MNKWGMLDSFSFRKLVFFILYFENLYIVNIVLLWELVLVVF